MTAQKMATAAVVRHLGAPPVLTEVPWPELPESAMIVKVDAATVCGTDVQIWRDGGSGARPPYIPGHETAGTIQQIRGTRRDVLGDALAIGDRVIWAYPFCGRCYYCSVASQPTLCRQALRFGRARCDQPPYLLGGCATHHYVPPESGVVKIPETVASELAASAACALRTVVHGFERLGGAAPHETCLVQGCGPVGLYAAAMARHVGFRQVLVIGAPAHRLELALRFGAHEALNVDTHNQEERREWALDMTAGRGADVVIQCATSQAIPEGLALVRPGGRYLSIGGGGDGPLQVGAEMLNTKMLRVIGVRSGEARHFHSALKFLESGAAPFQEMISGRYGMEDVGMALERMSTFKEIKPVVLPLET